MVKDAIRWLVRLLHKYAIPIEYAIRILQDADVVKGWHKEWDQEQIDAEEKRKKARDDYERRVAEAGR